jgi:Four helix bundle sensory module for signal transduction
MNGRGIFRTPPVLYQDTMIMRIRWVSLVISFLIVGGGWLGSRTLIRVDQDLRVIYTEYTLATTDLGHLNGELIRYRTSVIRAVETDNKQEFHRILASLPVKRTNINQTIERFVTATNDASVGRRLDARELAELKAVQEKIAAYMASSQHALEIIQQRWSIGPAAKAAEAQRVQDRARQYLADDAGSKYMSVTLELDRLLEVVAGIAGDVKKDADSTLRIVTLLLVTISLTLGVLVLVVG